MRVWRGGKRCHVRLDRLPSECLGCEKCTYLFLPKEAVSPAHLSRTPLCPLYPNSLQGSG